MPSKKSLFVVAFRQGTKKKQKEFETLDEAKKYTERLKRNKVEYSLQRVWKEPIWIYLLRARIGWKKVSVRIDHLVMATGVAAAIYLASA